jgi:hypothetical protein
MKSFLQYISENAETIVNWHKNFENLLQSQLQKQNTDTISSKGMVMFPGVNTNPKHEPYNIKNLVLTVDDQLNATSSTGVSSKTLGTYSKSGAHNPKTGREYDLIQLDPKHANIRTPNPVLHHEAEHARTLGPLSKEAFDKTRKIDRSVPYTFEPSEMAARRGEAYGKAKAEGEALLKGNTESLQKRITAQPTPKGWLNSDDPFQNPKTITGDISLNKKFQNDMLRLNTKYIGAAESNLLKQNMPSLSPEGQARMAKQIRRQPGRVADVAHQVALDMNKPGGQVDTAVTGNKWLAQARAPRMGAKTPVAGAYTPGVGAVSPSDPLGVANMVANTFGAADTPWNRNTRAKAVAGNPNHPDEREQADATAAVAGQYSDSGMEYTPGVNSPGTVDRVQALRTKEADQYAKKTGKDLMTQKLYGGPLRDSER